MDYEYAIIESKKCGFGELLFRAFRAFVVIDCFLMRNRKGFLVRNSMNILVLSFLYFILALLTFKSIFALNLEELFKLVQQPLIFKLFLQLLHQTNKVVLGILLC